MNIGQGWGDVNAMQGRRTAGEEEKEDTSASKNGEWGIASHKVVGMVEQMDGWMGWMDGWV